MSQSIQRGKQIWTQHIGHLPDRLLINTYFIICQGPTAQGDKRTYHNLSMRPVHQDIASCATNQCTGMSVNHMHLSTSQEAQCRLTHLGDLPPVHLTMISFLLHLLKTHIAVNMIVHAQC